MTKQLPDNLAKFMTRYLWRKLTFSKKPASFGPDCGLFEGAPQHEHFCRLDELAPVRRMPASSQPYTWPKEANLTLPEAFDLPGGEESTEQFLVDTDTAALVVIVDGVIRYERYLLTGGPKVNWLSMSVAKSFISTMVGIAVQEGFIGSIDEPISKYVPVKSGSAYDGVSIRTVLQMSSGARWNEDYNDKESDIFLIAKALQGKGGGLDNFVASMKKESQPETVCRYNSGETQVLGALIAKATGRSVASYMTEKLIEPMGFESPSFWVTDVFGTEMSFAGLNLTARDFAKLGELYRNGGMWQGKRIINEDWIKDSTTIDSPIREPGRPLVSDREYGLGYGYQWWVDNNKEDYTAIGVLNQFVYVNPKKKTVVVKLSANRKYGTSSTESTNRDEANVELFRAIANSVD